MEVTATGDITQLDIRPDSSLQATVTAHHRTSPVRVGQMCPVDLELHPGSIGRRGAQGVIRIFDAADNTEVAEPLSLTLAASPATSCTIAGRADGPLSPQSFDQVEQELAAGTLSARSALRRIERAERRQESPRRWWHRT